ncbi:hypothetical protein BGZ76_004477 [Entomortierella beljakovae]|nr:hypothetical protein BGZ76_004477 [Entomortierella beljakovae]
MCESWICPQSLAIDWPQPIPELVNSLACAVVVSSFVAIVHVVLPRLCYFTQSKLTFVTEATAVDAATILPICIAAESNEKGGVQFERTPVPVEREHINAVAGALQECEPQIAGTDVEPKSDLAEAHLNVSCQRKIGRAAKKREGVATIRKRSSSLTLEIALSPFKIPAPVRMVKSKLKVLGVLLPVFAPTIVPRPRSWTFPKTKSRESSHTYSQTTRDQVEDKITLKKDLQQDIEDATLCKTNDSSSTKPELSLIRANDRLLSPSASGLALWKLARMALDLERLDSIIHFYKHKHIAATETPESSKYASQEKDELAFVVRSSRLPTVRVGLYGATQKRLWTSTGSIDMASAEYLKESNAAYKPTFNVQL